MFEIIELGGMKTTKAKSAANHTYLVDCSGSMYSDLPKIRQQLKNIISVVAQPDDTFTVIWFSGRGQCGVVFENVLVSDLSTISMLHGAIDKWLKPMGLTGFVDPINLASTIAFDPTKVNNLVMLTDGWDNQSSKNDIIACVRNLKATFHSATFIEYGYYADRELLAKMAEETGGIHIFAEGYTQYEKVFNDVIAGTVRVNNISVPVNKRAKHCIFIYGKQIRIVPVIDGKVSVPEDTQKIHSVVPKDVLSKQLSPEHLYLILYYASKTDNSDLVWKCLEALGDVAMVELYQNAFTKQELSLFESSVESAVLDESLRFVKGRDLSAVPNKNAPTVIDLLGLLSDNGAELVTDCEQWDYNKTSRERVAGAELPKFVPSKLKTNIPLKGLVFNTSRPNVSIQTTRDGIVELPDNEFGLKTIPSNITRNYTIIRDGIKNVSKLPIIIGKNILPLFNMFKYELIESDDVKAFVVFDLSNTPVVKRSVVEHVSADDLIVEIKTIKENEIRNKVIKWYLDSMVAANAKTVGLTETYGESAANWLSSLGIRDYGFSPVGTSSSATTDVYEAVEVDYKIAGMSSIPAIAATIKKDNEIKQLKKEGKPCKKSLNLVEQMVMNAVGEFSQLSEQEFQDLRANVTKIKRNAELQLSKFVFALVLGRKWFSDDDVYESVIKFKEGETNISLTKQRKEIKI